MHTFQPIPVDMLDMNPFTKIGKEWALLTAGNKQESNTMTISWGGVGVLWGKNVVYVFVRDSRYTKELIDAGDFFSLTFAGPKVGTINLSPRGDWRMPSDAMNTIWMKELENLEKNN